MIAELSAAISGAKGILDLSRGVAALTTEHAVQERTIELQSQVLALVTQLVDIQLRIADLVHENADIRRELADFVDWRRDVVPKYDLVELAKSVYAYQLRDLPSDVEGVPEPKHYLCYGCFQKRRKSVLQFSGYNNMGAILTCNECGVSLIDHSDKPPSFGPVTVRRKPSPWDNY
ncbi:hypothetical protein [Geobacter sp.]|uniref:hypothetical protein n=1 Tax=Geobacter sp. TaxID=46610 RepID=UPI00261DB952|nr:hypothetical protein [Geobacter sp.]